MLSYITCAAAIIENVNFTMDDLVLLRKWYRPEDMSMWADEVNADFNQLDYNSTISVIDNLRFAHNYDYKTVYEALGIIIENY